MNRKAGRRFWRDPRWWASFELGIAAFAVLAAVFLRLAQPGFMGMYQPDTMTTDLLAVLGLVVGLALMLRLSRPRV